MPNISRSSDLTHASTGCILTRMKKHTPTPEPPKQRKGFAVMKAADRVRIASMGGKAVALKMGHKGMAAIGRKGGTTTARRYLTQPRSTR